MLRLFSFTSILIFLFVMMIVCCHYLVAQAAASGKMRICGLADFQTCKMRMVLRIFFVDVTGKLRMRTQYYKLKITYFVEIFIVGIT